MAKICLNIKKISMPKERKIPKFVFVHTHIKISPMMKRIRLMGIMKGVSTVFTGAPRLEMF